MTMQPTIRKNGRHFITALKRSPLSLPDKKQTNLCFLLIIVQLLQKMTFKPNALGESQKYHQCKAMSLQYMEQKQTKNFFSLNWKAFFIYLLYTMFG